jgi:hypothetical protein
LEEEFMYNPFLRYDAPDIIEAMGSDMRDPERVMAKLRERKNSILRKSRLFFFTCMS